jgi:Flp pilus assembly protein TadG
LPAGDAVAVSFNPAGNVIVVGHALTPFVTAYPWSAGFGTKYANPATLPPSNVNDAAFIADGTVLALAHDNTPYISAYAWSSGFGTKYADPATLPTGTGRGVDFL